MFSPFKNNQIFVRFSEKGGSVILADVLGVFSGEAPWTSVSKKC
jgi:hypothetical protein